MVCMSKRLGRCEVRKVGGGSGSERTIPCTDRSTELSNPRAPWAVEAQMEG